MIPHMAFWELFHFVRYYCRRGILYLRYFFHSILLGSSNRNRTIPKEIRCDATQLLIHAMSDIFPFLSAFALQSKAYRYRLTRNEAVVVK